MLGHKHLIQLHAVGARGAHAERRFAAPVVEHRELTARYRENLGLRLLAIFLEQHIADEMRGVGNARAIIPGAVDDIAAVNALACAGRDPDAMRRAKIPIGAEQFELRALWPMRRDQRAMGGRKRETPAHARIAARDFQHDAVERHIIEFIAAEHLRLQDAVKAGVAKFPVHLRRMAAARVVVILRGADRGPQRDGAFHQHLGSHAGFRHGQADKVIFARRFGLTSEPVACETTIRL